ncbi:adult-specific cuticular protein ACP-22-like [Musca vetustissima]|uniref:adult-specific cuticular protein ACP-22-like n=1 Tax=Musca vetustissima TaxID=27455 RepID=UPI002AB6ED13|nr:adult-specific cuticular protein ACP-22-like [Musca vetustissima]
MKFITIGSFLALSGLAAAGHLHGHGVTSYSVETKHEPSLHHSWSHGHSGDSHGLSAGHGHESHHVWESHPESHIVSSDSGHDGHDEHYDEYAHPKYEFKYGVKDPKTGDVKDQWEERDGDKVKGGYTFKEADGTTRVVEYHADKHSGFNAVVKNIGHAHHEEVEQQHHDSGHLKHSHGHGW